MRKDHDCCLSRNEAVLWVVGSQAGIRFDFVCVDKVGFSGRVGFKRELHSSLVQSFDASSLLPFRITSAIATEFTVFRGLCIGCTFRLIELNLFVEFSF